MKKNFLLICSIMVVMPLFSQQFDSIASVIITATRIDQSLEKSGRAVQIISKEDIATSNATSFDELLRLKAGVNINSRGGFGVQSDIGLRGSTFSQVLIMLDNMRLNDPLTGHFNYVLPIALSEIEQIEIILGPAAVAYGADAVGGLIHIKSRIYAQNQKQKETSSKGSIAYGEESLFMSDANIYYQNNKLILNASSKINQSLGQEFVNPNFGKNAAADSLFYTKFNLQNLSASAAYLINDEWKVQGRFSYDFRKFGAKYFYTASTFDESKEQVNSLWSQVNVFRNHFKGQFNNATEINLGYRKTYDDFLFNPAFAANVHTVHKLAVNINQRLQFSEHTKWAVGTQIENRTLYSTDRGNHTNLDAGLYLIYNRQLMTYLHITFGNRLAYNTNYGFQYLPQLSLAYNGIKKLTLRASAGKSIRGADFTERYVSFNLVNPSAGRNIGNPDLKSEISYAGDLGFQYNLSKGQFISGTVFYRKSQNLIDYAKTNSNNISNVKNLIPNTDYLYTQNIAKANTAGFEASYSVEKLVSKNLRIKDQLNYTFINTSNPAGVISKYFANHPKHNISMVTSIIYKRFLLSFDVNYLIRNADRIAAIDGKIPSEYLVFNSKLSYELKKDEVKIFFQALNLTDTKYQEILGSPMPRRWFMGGFNWTL